MVQNHHHGHLYSSVFAIGRRKRVFLAAIVLAIPAVIALWIVPLFNLPQPQFWNFVCSLVLLVFTTVTVLSEFLNGEEMNTDNLNGGIMVYLVVGFAETILYWLIETLCPGSFLIRGLFSNKNKLSILTLIY